MEQALYFFLLYRNDGVMEYSTTLAATSKRSKPEVLYLTSQLIWEYIAHFHLDQERPWTICSSFWVEDM